MKRPLPMVMTALAGVGFALAGVALAAGGHRTPRPVVVPRVAGAYDLIHSYRRLHHAGLAMAIPQQFSLGSLCLLSARAQSPAAGARVARGATVTLRWLRCALGSPAGGGSRTIVPNLVGRSASRAVSWAEHAGLYWQLDRLPPLRRSGRIDLLDNYLVTAQSPRAGSLLTRGTNCSTYAAKCFRVTPLLMRARLRR